MQSAYATYTTGTPTELMIFRGKTHNGREIEMVVGEEMAKEILTVAAQAYAVCGHIGHAMWHAKNNNIDFENCSSCKK